MHTGSKDSETQRGLGLCAFGSFSARNAQSVIFVRSLINEINGNNRHPILQCTLYFAMFSALCASF